MHFDLQPVLKGELIELRPLRADDFDALYKVASDPLIWEQHPERNRYREEVFRRLFQESLASGGALVAINSETEEVIGSSRFHAYDERLSQIEIGWTFLARSFWGGEFNGEMKRLMLGHAFKFVESVIFVIGEENIRSQRAMERIGGRRVGTRTDANGRTNFIYRISRLEFENKLSSCGQAEQR
jgi:RimJ/RimL family protein N-acetyltransferase